MYMHQESNTQLTRTHEKPFTQATVLTIRPPGRYRRTKLMKYDRLGGFTCAQFLFWESQCGGELGQLLDLYAVFRSPLRFISKMYSASIKGKADEARITPLKTLWFGNRDVHVGLDHVFESVVTIGIRYLRGSVGAMIQSCRIDAHFYHQRSTHEDGSIL